MKITDVITHVLGKNLEEPFFFSQGRVNREILKKYRME